MTKNEQVLTWGGIIIVLVFLAFGFKRGSITYVDNSDIMGPQLGGFPDIVIYNTDYQLGDIRIDRAMEYPSTGSCGCSRGSGLTLDPTPIERYVIPPLPPRDPFRPVVPQGPPPLPKITVFKDANYSGKMLTFRSPVSNMETTGLGLNDGISSIQVVGSWEVFEHAYFTGKSKIINFDIANLHGDYLQDRISSMRPVK